MSKKQLCLLAIAAAWLMSILLIVEMHNQQWLTEFSRAFAAAIIRYDQSFATALYWGVIEIMDNYPLFGLGGV